MRVRDESDLQSLVTAFLKSDEGTRWCHALPFFICEIKVVDAGKRGFLPLHMSQVEEHQRAALCKASGLHARGAGLAYKIPDSAMGLKPFDFFYARRAPSFLGVCYLENEEGTKWELWMIEWEKIVGKYELPRKEQIVTIEEAREIGIFLPINKT